MRRTAPLVLLLSTALLTACGSDSSDTSAAREAPSKGGTAGKSAVAGPSTVVVQRSVIRTAQLVVDTPDVSKAWRDAIAIATRVRGQVESVSTSLDGDAYSNVVLRVSPERLDAVVDELAALGDERHRHIDARDVTEDVVDVQSRLATQRASVARVRELLARAGSLADITTVEAQLTSREAELESLQNRLATLQGQTDLATVNLELHKAAPDALAGLPGFTEGLRGGWQAVTWLVSIVEVTAGALVPFTPLLLVVFVVREGLRRRRTPAEAGSSAQ